MANRQIAGLEILISANAAQLRESLKQASTALNGFQRQTQTIQRLLGGLGVGIGIYQLGSAVRDAINVFKEFEFKMSEVKAITNATDQEFLKLSEDALRLGRNTVFTAREVAGLQVAYGRLGFSTKEIINATEATLNLAAATNTDLASAADVAGSTVRGFQLDASETVRVTDVMTSSFNKSALAIDYFRESMKFVAPVANAAGASVEETTALLGVLANAGIRGSIAGTSLRRIFSDLTKDGRPLRDRLQELASRGLTLADAYDEIGRVSQTSLLVLTRNIDAFDKLSLALQNASGEAQRVAEIRLDNLQGDVIRLISSWEGFLLSIQSSSFYRKIINDLTVSFNFLSGGINQASTLISGLGEQFKRLDAPSLSNLFALNAEGNIDRFLEKLRELVEETGKPVQIELVERAIARFGIGLEEADKFREAVRNINEEVTGFTGTSFDVFIRLNNELKQARSNFENLPIDTSADEIERLSNVIFGLESNIQKLTKARLSEYLETISFSAEGLANRLGEVKEVIPAVFGVDNTTLSRTNLIINNLKKGVIETTASYTELKGVKEELTRQFDGLNALQEDERRQKADLILLLEAEIKRIGDLIRLRAQLGSLSRAGSSQSEDERNRLLGVSPIQTNGSDFFRDLGLDFSLSKDPILGTIDAVNESIDKSINSVSNWAKSMTILKDIMDSSFTEMANRAAYFGNAVGEALGDVLTGTANIGQAIAQVADRVVQELGRIAIAQIIAKSAITGKNPIAAIALAAAATAAISRLLRNAAGYQQRSRGGGGGGGSVGSNSVGTLTRITYGDRIELTGEFVVDGARLKAVISNQNRIDGRVKSSWP